MTNTNTSHKDTRLLARLHPLLLALTLVLSPLLGLRSAHAASPDTIVAWGYNGYGQSNAPAGLHDVVAIAAGVYHSLALKGDGTVVAWGCGSGFDSGQCSVPAGLHDVVAIAAGDTHSLALKRDGRVVAWGDNGQGQSTVPAGLYDVVALAAGSSHSLALKGDGTVVAWGNNFEGQSTVPAGLYDVVALAAGWFHSLALKGDGTIVAWGCGSGGDSGQCSVPAGLSDVVATAAGYRHSLALKGDGTVVAWGCGSGFDSGQCSVPAGLHDVVAIAAGNSHNLALKRDGRVVAWGYNRYGQSTVPAGLYDVVALAAGVFHSLVIGAVDATAPTASPTQSPAAPGNGWNNSDVTVTWNWTDQADGSGLDLAHCTTSSTSSGEGARSLTVPCTDLAGNQGSASYTVQVDKTPPTLSPLVSPNSVALGGTATVTSGAADALSGLASESCGALDTSSPGSKSVTCTATDHAGNTTSVTVNYQVVYNWTGFFQPVDNLPTVNTVNAGQGIPVKFSLNGDYGLNIFASGYPKVQTFACGSGGSSGSAPIEETVSAGASSLQYDPGTQSYIYIWKTDKAWAGSCRQLIVRLIDGTDHSALFQFNGKVRSASEGESDASEENIVQQLFLPLVNR